MLIFFIVPLQSFPCIYMMLSQRDQAAYKSAFQSIEEKWHFQMSKVWIDYDLQLRNAVADVHPRVIMSAFWYQFCYAMRRKCKIILHFYENVYLSNASHLFHQVLCIPLMPQNKIADAVVLMKRKCGVFPPLQQMLKIFDDLLRREGVRNICVDWDWFGEKCTQNYNEFLKNKSSVTSSISSLFYLIQLLKTEQNKINASFRRQGNTLHKDNLQVTVIKKFRQEFNIAAI